MYAQLHAKCLCQLFTSGLKTGLPIQDKHKLTFSYFPFAELKQKHKTIYY